jgi:hypothetical protein
MIDFNQAFVDAIRLDASDPPSDILSDAQILNVCRLTVQDMNDRLTNKVLRSFTTVEDQQAYDVDPVTTRVSEVFRESAVSAIFGSSGIVSSIDVGGAVSYVVGQMGTDSGLSWFEYPSLFMEWSRKLKAAKNIDPKSWVFLGKQILLMPPPDATGDVVMYLSIERFTEAHIPANWEYFVRWGVLAECLNLIAVKRWNEAGVNVGGGMTSFSPQSFLVSQGKEYRTKYEEACNKISMMSLDLRSAV